jgi:hypothetical protein
LVYVEGQFTQYCYNTKSCDHLTAAPATAVAVGARHPNAEPLHSRVYKRKEGRKE